MKEGVVGVLFGAGVSMLLVGWIFSHSLVAALGFTALMIGIGGFALLLAEYEKEGGAS